jgi:hypothetical protein
MYLKGMHPVADSPVPKADMGDREIECILLIGSLVTGWHFSGYDHTIFLLMI